MTLLNIQAKIMFLDINAGIKGIFPDKLLHFSGYESGYSPDTDILPVIDIDRNILKFEYRNICEETGLLHPTVHLFLYDQNGDLLIQKRGANKSSSAGKLAQSVGGHVAVKKIGFTPLDLRLKYDPVQTLIKESREELGIELTDFSLVSTFLYESKNKKNRELVHLYKGSYFGPILPNYTEVKWAAFFDPMGIIALSIKKPYLFSPSFINDFKFIGLEIKR